MNNQLEIYSDPSAGITATAPKVEPIPPALVSLLEILGDHLTVDTLPLASSLLRDITDYEQGVKKVFDEHTRAADKLHKFLTNLRGIALGQIRSSKGRVKGLIDSYQEEQLRIANEERRKKLEEDDRLRRIEKERLEQEALEKALEEARNNPSKAEDAFKDLESIEEPAPKYTPPPIPLTAPRIAGITTRVTWRYKLVDIVSLARAVSSGTAPPECIMPNDKFFNDSARRAKGDSPWPGIEFYSERINQSS